MPVPLPPQEVALRTPPSRAEVLAIWRALVTAVGGGADGLSPLQDLLLRAVTTSMTGVGDLPPAEPVTPADFAASMERRDRVFRERVCQVMMLSALVRRPPDSAAMRRVADFAVELDLDGQLVEVTASYAEGGFDLAVHDFERLGHLGAGPAPTPPGTSPLADGAGSVWFQVPDDPALAARWGALGELPTGSLGRSVHDFYRARGFAFPGLPGSAPPMLAQHDWVHVLADYGTALESELEVFGYIARANDDPRAFSLLAMVVSLFETGVVARGMGLFEASPGHLASSGMPQRLADALRRGALTAGSRDFMTLDWFAVADRPVDVVRREWAVPPKSEVAVALGSAGPSQRGGISAYQESTGRAAAAAEGWDYQALVRASAPAP